MPNPIRFIHITDTHIGPTKDFEWFFVKPYSCTERIIKHLNNLKDKPDFVLHTGDITAQFPDKPSFTLAQEILSRLNYPVYYVTGNHDSSGMIKDYFPMKAITPLVKDESKNAYYFDVQNYRFITLDGRGPDEIDPHGSLSPDQFVALEEQLKQEDKLFILSIHFPPVKLDSLWLDKDMLLFEGDRLHSLFKEHRDKVLGVFFGHVHRGLQVVNDGVFYSSVGSSYMQFQSYPSKEDVIFESTGRSYFNYVTIQDHQMIIKEYSIPNDTKPFVKTKKELV
jgi:3',5'-cyclic AMP phosphodiesterase CpdA